MARPNTKITADALLKVINNDKYRPDTGEFKINLLEIAVDMQSNRALGHDWKILESAELPKDSKGFSIVGSDDLTVLAGHYFSRFKAASDLPEYAYDEALAWEASVSRAAQALVDVQDYVDSLGVSRAAGEKAR